MKCKIIAPKYHFITLFDDETGAYIRSGIIKKGRDTGEDPFMASFPHLIDVGVMGHCIHGKTGLCRKAGTGCYQNGAVTEKSRSIAENPNLSAKRPEQYTGRNLSEQCNERRGECENG